MENNLKRCWIKSNKWDNIPDGIYTGRDQYDWFYKITLTEGKTENKFISWIYYE
jgi:hypothetical protein